jgi:hypothetical protein
MADSFLGAVACRAADQLLPPLSSQYAAIAHAMPPAVRELLVYNIDPATVDSHRLLVALGQDGSAHEWAGRTGAEIISVPGALVPTQCAALRASVDAATMELTDSVDEQLEYQCTLSIDDLEALIGIAAIEWLSALATACYKRNTLPMSPEAEAAARAAGIICTSPVLPDEPHYIFIRRYSATTRPWTAFHYDRASLTLNVSLTDEADHTGGRLLAILQGSVRSCERREGTATLHMSTLMHGVTRMTSGERYSLILFYRPKCPHADHALVRCDAPTMTLLYPLESGAYSCDSCGDSAAELGHPAMWHCSVGCEYDVCDACYNLGCFSAAADD